MNIKKKSNCLQKQHFLIEIFRSKTLVTIATTIIPVRTTILVNSVYQEIVFEILFQI